MLRRIAFSVGILIVLAIAGGWYLYRSFSDDFFLEADSYKLLNLNGWDLNTNEPSKLEELSSILCQHFSYLDQGRQTSVFLSNDGNYVLKIFKFSQLKPSWLDKFRRKVADRKARHLTRTFRGYHLAYTLDKNNCGLVYVHLQISDTLRQQIIVNDRFGFSHALDLDSLIFAIQKTGIVTRNVFHHLLKSNDVAGVKEKINQIFDLYISEYEKGLYDSDHNLMHNTGFIDGKPVRLDVGRLSLYPPISSTDVYKKDLENIAEKRIARWFRVYYPDLESDIRAAMQGRLSKI